MVVKCHEYQGTIKRLLNANDCLSASCWKVMEGRLFAFSPSDAGNVRIHSSQWQHWICKGLDIITESPIFEPFVGMAKQLPSSAL